MPTTSMSPASQIGASLEFGMYDVYLLFKQELIFGIRRRIVKLVHLVKVGEQATLLRYNAILCA